MNAFAFAKRGWVLAILGGVFLVAFTALCLPEKRVRAQGGDGGGDNQGGDISRIRRGFEIAPLPLNITDQNPALVGLGSYYVNGVSECADCHTNFPQYLPGGNPFLGQPKQVNVNNYLRGGHTFPLPDPTGLEHPITSRNIRPINGLPAGLTLAQFIDVMRNGTDYDHPGRLLQVMQWPILQNMTDRDLLAIYSYLSTLPP
jgi:hypothetical protein